MAIDTSPITGVLRVTAGMRSMLCHNNLGDTKTNLPSITFERVPSDYAILKITDLPEAGGDTLWASGYELYDRLSPTIQKVVDGLEAVHYQVIIPLRNSLSYLLTL